MIGWFVTEKNWDVDAAVKVYRFMYNAMPPPGPQKNVEKQAHVSSAFSTCFRVLSRRYNMEYEVQPLLLPDVHPTTSKPTKQRKSFTHRQTLKREKHN